MSFGEERERKKWINPDKNRATGTKQSSSASFFEVQAARFTENDGKRTVKGPIREGNRESLVGLNLDMFS